MRPSVRIRADPLKTVFGLRKGLRGLRKDFDNPLGILTQLLGILDFCIFFSRFWGGPPYSVCLSVCLRGVPKGRYLWARLGRGRRFAVYRTPLVALVAGPTPGSAFKKSGIEDL